MGKSPEKPVGQTGLENLLPFFKALADQSRLRIVGLLADRERNVRDLATRLRLKEPTVSHHLAILRVQGLVELRADGNTHWYRLDQDALNALHRGVFSGQSPAAPPARAEPHSYDHKVLANFLDGERLIEIPVSRKKRSVILRWLAHRFEPGATYSEADVNQVIKRHHGDCATLRRELIGARMLQRERGLYRRRPEAEWVSD
jgi:DNA-binding transcriptional ArsR family regulator